VSALTLVWGAPAVPYDPVVISGIIEGTPTTTGVVISWNCDIGAQGQIEYDTNTGVPYASASTLETDYLTYHSQAISGLTAGTLYYYRIKAISATGAVAYSTEDTFTTEVATTIYGPGLNLDSKGNQRITPASITKLSNRFRASTSSAISTVRFAQRGGSGYSLGTGGTMLVSIQSDDGSANNYPSGSVLASKSYTPGNAGFPSAWEKWDTVTFASPFTAVSGTIYHIVFENTDGSPSANYISVNMAFCYETLSPRQPYYSDGIFVSLNYTGSWSVDNHHLPSVDITYANGTHDGSAYVNNRRDDYALIGGANMARELFTVSGGTRSVTQAYVRCNKQSGTGVMTVTLKTAAGTTLGSGTIAASTFPAWTLASDTDTGNWGSVTFDSPVTLTNGQQYQLVLSAAADTQFAMVPFTYEYQWGLSFSSRKFTEGVAQKSSNTGSSWAAMASLASNMQCYFVAT